MMIVAIRISWYILSNHLAYLGSYYYEEVLFGISSGAFESHY